MTTRETHEYITIGLPIPIDVFGTLGDLIDKAWPGSAIITNPRAAGVPEDVINRLGHGGWGGFGSHDSALIKITKRAPKRVSKKAVQSVVAAHQPEGEPLDFNGFDGEWMKLTPPTELAAYLGELMWRILDGFEDAVNYVEWSMHPKDDKGDARDVVLSVARSKGQTPGALLTTEKALRAKTDELLSAQTKRVRALADELEAACPGADDKHSKCIGARVRATIGDA